MGVEGEEKRIYLHYLNIVNAEFAFFVRLAGFEDLFYGDGSKSFSSVGGLDWISYGVFRRRESGAGTLPGVV